MTVPVTLVESNPVTDVFYAQSINYASADTHAIAGPAIVLGGNQESTYSREITYVFATGVTIPGGQEFGSDISISLQGRRGGQWITMTGVMDRTLEIGEGGDATPVEKQVTIMYMNADMLREIGIASSAGADPNLPFDAVRYRVILTGGPADTDVLPFMVFGFGGDLRYGLFGTDAQLASQLKGNARGLTDTDTTIYNAGNTKVIK